nr:hypothetical protein CFP56_09589 [Quercus suber]
MARVLMYSGAATDHGITIAEGWRQQSDNVALKAALRGDGWRTSSSQTLSLDTKESLEIASRLGSRSKALRLAMDMSFDYDVDARKDQFIRKHPISKTGGRTRFFAGRKESLLSCEMLVNNTEGLYASRIDLCKRGSHSLLQMHGSEHCAHMYCRSSLKQRGSAASCGRADSSAMWHMGKVFSRDSKTVPRQGDMSSDTDPFFRGCSFGRRADKCDLVRPVCGRCARRGTLCEGYQVAGSLTFKDETAHAESLSRRSRRSSKEISSSRPGQTTPVHNQSSTNPNRGGLYYPWLSEQARANVPSHIKRSSETIAVEHFFANWIAAPNDSSPGHMHHLPLLYESASRGSVLTLSVRAVAFADLARLAIDGREYTIEGLKSYGAALVSLRRAVQDTTSLDHDQILSALLLVDEFEVKTPTFPA